MLTRFYFTLTLLLSAVMLLSSSGIVLGKMICLKTGREVVKINSAADSCCLEEEQETELSKQCCTFKSYGITTDNYVQAQQLLLKAPVWIDAPLTSFASIPFYVHHSPVPVQVCSKPPPRDARVTLQFNQTFLI
ncbi:MAG: hypothetical protein MUC87_06700 [Bacteroidia bacterium]|jgi:hypothetical protein|nr:hypothetical protein [Bacteroidia bacterium]